MQAKRAISWFLTEKGRRFSFTVVTATGIGLTAAKFTPHTFFLQKYKEFVHHYNNSLPAELPKELFDRYNKCLDLVNIPDAHKKLITPFSVFGYDLFHAGSLKSRFGAAIGIPINFTYKSFSDLENDDIKVNQKKIDWTSETGQKLADALILPEKVQEFAIAREILSVQNSKVFIESVYPFASIFLTYTISQGVNKKLNLYASPLMIRGVLYTLTGLFGVGLYFFLKDYTEVTYETGIDKKLCELGPEYIESGVVFYDKLLKRNQALRELMGKEGESKYSKLGNENFGIRQPRIALIHRKQFFEEKLKEEGKLISQSDEN